MVTLEQRVNRLERSAARWRLAAGVLGVALVAAVGWGAGKGEDLPDLKVRSLEVIDPQTGRQVAYIGLGEAGNGLLDLNHSNGKRALRMLGTKDGANVIMTDAEGHTNLMLSTDAEESAINFFKPGTRDITGAISSKHGIMNLPVRPSSRE